MNDSWTEIKWCVGEGRCYHFVLNKIAQNGTAWKKAVKLQNVHRIPSITIPAWHRLVVIGNRNQSFSILSYRELAVEMGCGLW